MFSLSPTIYIASANIGIYFSSYNGYKLNTDTFVSASHKCLLLRYIITKSFRVLHMGPSHLIETVPWVQT